MDRVTLEQYLAQAEAQTATCCGLHRGMKLEESDICSGALVVHHVAEQLPGLALEARQLDGLDRIEVGRAGRDGDARQEARQVKLVMACRLLHQGLARPHVPALPQPLSPQRPPA